MRLETISRNLCESFRQAGEEQRRRAALIACEIAVLQTGLHGAAVDAAIGAIRRGGSDASVRLEIEALGESFDVAYFRLKEQGEPNTNPQVLHWFRKARAAAALAFALSADSDQLQESMYEATIASDDATEVVRAVEKALS